MRARRRRKKPVMSGALQHPVDRRDQLGELRALVGEPPLSGSGQGVEAGAAIVLGRTPFGIDVAVEEQSLQGRIERALAHLEDILREELEPLRDAVSVHRLARENPQNQEIERAGKQVRRNGAGHELSYRLSM